MSFASRTQEWLSVAAEPRVCRRAFTYALVVGSILILINHADALMRGDMDGIRLMKMLLTALVPYTVSTASSVGALLEQRREGSQRGPSSQR